MRRLPLILVAAASLVACKKTIDHDKLVKTIKDGMEQSGLKVKTVNCPDGHAAKKDDNFTCSADTAEGQHVQIDVIQQDDDGTIKWQAKGMSFNVAKIQTVIGEKIGKPVTLKCAHDSMIVQVKDTITCDATAGGETKKLDITVENDKGDLTWKEHP